MYLLLLAGKRFQVSIRFSLFPQLEEKKRQKAVEEEREKREAALWEERVREQQEREAREYQEEVRKKREKEVRRGNC